MLLDLGVCAPLRGRFEAHFSETGRCPGPRECAGACGATFRCRYGVL